MKRRYVLLWIFCLAWLAVGARNFESGLTIDAPLYASIARNIARSGEWFRMYGNVPDFVPFAEHPHLGFWVEALVFKFFPAADWSARLPGHIFYVAFLFAFFLFNRRLSGERSAIVSVLLLWIWSRFGNYFSTVYLDPGALFFGFIGVWALYESLDKASWAKAVVAGFSLALCALYKGLTVLGFGPVCAAVFLNELMKPARPRSQTFLRVASASAVFVSLLACYTAAIHRSSVPDFLDIYFQRQYTNRFAHAWAPSGLFSLKYWKVLCVDTLGVVILVPLALKRFRSGPGFWLPALLLFSFVLAYAPAQRTGAQYDLMVMPWIAWLVGQACADKLSDEISLKLVKVTAIVSVMATLFLQYGDVATHRVPPMDLLQMGEITHRYHLKTLYLESPRDHVDFITSSGLAWYGDIEVKYVLGSALTPPAQADSIVLLEKDRTPKQLTELTSGGWCLYRDNFGPTLWMKCAAAQ